MTNKTTRPTIAQLRAFVAIVESGHFTTAAQKLGVSQPTLSQALTALEQAVGATLIERDRRTVLITTEGRRLLPSAQATVQAMAQFEGQSGIHEGEREAPLRVGLIPTVAPYLLPGVTAELKAKGLQAKLVEDHTAPLMAALKAGTVDAAVLALDISDRTLVGIPLFEEDFFLAVPAGHELAGQAEVALADIADEELILLGEGNCLRDQTLELCGDNSVSRMASMHSLGTAMQCVAAGMGVTVIPASAVQSFIGLESVALRPFAAPVPGRLIGLVHRRSAVETGDFHRLVEILTNAARSADFQARIMPAQALSAAAR